jgi:hypothetical protein
MCRVFKNESPKWRIKSSVLDPELFAGPGSGSVIRISDLEPEKNPESDFFLQTEFIT